MPDAYQVVAQQVVATAPIFYGIITPGSSVALQARVSDAAGALIVPSGITSITAVITEMMGDVVGSPITINPSTGVFTTLQLAGWSIDSTGYNLQVLLDAGNFTTAATTYQVVITIVPATGSAFTLVWHLQTESVI